MDAALGDHPTVGVGSRSRAGHSRDEFRQRVERGVEEPLRGIRAVSQAREVRQGLQGQRNPHLWHRVWETFGAISSEGEAYLRQLMRFASKHLDLEHSSYCGRMWSRLSCVLQRQIAREIELRTNGQKYQYKRDEDE